MGDRGRPLDLWDRMDAAEGQDPAEPGPFVPVRDEAEVEALLARSHTEPVIVFKHDPFCGVSTGALREMRRLGAPAALVDVARQRPVAAAVAARTGVRHESPQVLVLRHGQAAWAASHWDISAEAVGQALRRHG